MPEHHLNGKPRPWHDDVLDASRAIFAETKALIREETGKVATDLPVQIAKMVERIVDQRLREFEKGLGDRVIKEAVSLIDAKVAGVAEAVRNVIASAAPPVVHVTVPDHGPPIVNVSVPEFNIPQPSVVVNAPEIRFPELDFSAMPAPVVNVAPPSVTVQAPDLHLPAPNVSVNVPEFSLPAPNVSVNVPRRRVKKQISYDDAGRPVEIEEVEE